MMMSEDFYVCPQHMGTGGYESCCNCSGWQEDDPNYGRRCTEAIRAGDNPKVTRLLPVDETEDYW